MLDIICWQQCNNHNLSFGSFLPGELRLMAGILWGLLIICILIPKQLDWLSHIDLKQNIVLY